MRSLSRLRRWFAFAAVLCAAAAPANAQTFNLDSGREALVSLDGLWRFHPGDSPKAPDSGAPFWASAAFNDSSWTLLRSDRSFSSQGYEGMSGFAWYRFQVVVPPGDKPTSLLLAPIFTSYQIYVEGKLAGQAGQMPPGAIPSPPMMYQIYPLTTSGAGRPRIIQVALRVWHSPIWAGYVGGGPFRGDNLAGDPELLSVERQHHQVVRNVRFVDSYSYSITAALVGLAVFCLFFIRPAEREYLWFASMLLAESADSALYVCQTTFSWPPIPIYDFTDGLLVALDIGASLCFFSRVLDVPIGRVGRPALALVFFSPFAAILYWPGLASVPTSATIQIVCLLPAVAWFLAVLIHQAWTGNLDARLLLLPTLLVSGFYFADNLAIVLAQFGLTNWPRIFEVQLPLPPFTVQTGTLLHLVFLLALLVFLIRRFSLARRREERLAGEFEAARQVQQVMLPAQPDQCPGFTVDWVYEPDEQVGGDFFQQIADGEGGMLIVIGDVSGKGLPAAMTVSMLVGVIRTEADHNSRPAALLESLNARLVGRPHGGFATCLAVHVRANGRLSLANAGHLPPYLNGEEVAISGSLPLGIAAHAEFESATLQLAPGDRLVLLSDGVVEAQSRTGELFGFERTRALSRDPANRIADAARTFGQSDDITVVTLEFSGAAVPAAL